MKDINKIVEEINKLNFEGKPVKQDFRNKVIELFKGYTYEGKNYVKFHEDTDDEYIDLIIRVDHPDAPQIEVSSVDGKAAANIRTVNMTFDEKTDKNKHDKDILFSGIQGKSGSFVAAKPIKKHKNKVVLFKEGDGYKAYPVNDIKLFVGEKFDFNLTLEGIIASQYEEDNDELRKQIKKNANKFKTQNPDISDNFIEKLNKFMLDNPIYNLDSEIDIP